MQPRTHSLWKTHRSHKWTTTLCVIPASSTSRLLNSTLKKKLTQMPCTELHRCVASINCQFIILTYPIHVNVITDSDHAQPSDSDSTYDLNLKARVLCWERQLRLAAVLPCRNFEIQASHMNISIPKCHMINPPSRPSSGIHLKVSP
jgi:hypothetical protein